MSATTADSAVDAETAPLTLSNPTPRAAAPLFRDPIFDGATDPVVVFNRDLGQWWMFYTQRRATAEGPGVAWVHGSDIGVAVSGDDGATWLYRGILEGLDFEWGRNTFWAPEIVWAQGRYHMYVSYIRGVPVQWPGHDREIEHYTSPDLLTWTHVSRLDLGSHKVIDACIFPLAGALRAASPNDNAADDAAPEGTAAYRMWFKNEAADSHTYAADSDDLFTWTPIGPVITGRPHEGPNVFALGGYFWMIVDEWQGQRVYRSGDLQTWHGQGLILDRPGTRPDDTSIGLHADVIVPGAVSLDTIPADAEHAYVFYFTHPGQDGAPFGEVTYAQRRSSIQVARLTVISGELVCERSDVGTVALGG
ncbi:hypothetical protein SAMN05216410_3315 [Sanguibacter gelidistatuariae]|uniref:Glycosyl hydrolases family 43 n=1 Tax=Sanguibacter gelidistatuariae TaxID=1814289 RepID=A0A1G6UQ68_9MICO|nr:hypothetical protein [Sanguibacter gelidistatuariae]SDD43451.1 hypothetical protein SAMN05216410_3315 [Sanguibacter gelidistatuariae]